MRIFPAAAAVAALLFAVTVPAAEVSRPIEVAAPGRAVIVLDRDVYENARADLGDLRISDDEGREVPYLLVGAADDSAPTTRPVLRDASYVRGEKAMVTLDFGAPTPKSALTLALSGDNFRRRVTVEGRDGRDREWVTIVDRAYVFAVPPPAAARYETIALPENGHQLLRVTVFRGPDDPDRIGIIDARASLGQGRRPPETALSAGVNRAEDTRSHETILTLDLGARHQPFRGVALEVAAPRFWRGVTVEARVDPAPGREAVPLSWTSLGEGAVYRVEHEGDVRESLRVDVCGRHRVIRLRIRNRDDAPLPIGAVTVMAAEERIAFEAAPGRSYRLAYGDARRTAPSYDLSRTAGDAALFAAQGRPGTIGPAVRQRDVDPVVPWTERNPALLWGGLLAVVLALGALTRQALRAD